MAIDKITLRNWFKSEEVPGLARADKVNEVIDTVNGITECKRKIIV
jgi:hypothetical protein